MRYRWERGPYGRVARSHHVETWDRVSVFVSRWASEEETPLGGHRLSRAGRTYALDASQLVDPGRVWSEDAEAWFERTPRPPEGAARVASLGACRGRFGRLPRYHPFVSRWSSGTPGVALAEQVAGGRPGRGFRPALALVTLAHLEAVAVTCPLRAYRRPVRTIWDAVRSRRAGPTREG